MSLAYLPAARWAEDDLVRVGSKLAEFADDQFHSAVLKRRLLEEVSDAIRRFENQTGLTVT
jgi:hypothetical protein